jgi:hypothetical protein
LILSALSLCFALGLYVGSIVYVDPGTAEASSTRLYDFTVTPWDVQGECGLIGEPTVYRENDFSGGQHGWTIRLVRSYFNPTQGWILSLDEINSDGSIDQSADPEGAITVTLNEGTLASEGCGRKKWYSNYHIKVTALSEIIYNGFLYTDVDQSMAVEVLPFVSDIDDLHVYTSASGQSSIVYGCKRLPFQCAADGLSKTIYPTTSNLNYHFTFNSEQQRPF